LIHVLSSIQSRTFTSFAELTAAYESGELHPGDLKPALAKSLNKILEVTISDYVRVLYFFFQVLKAQFQSCILGCSVITLH